MVCVHVTIIFISLFNAFRSNPRHLSEVVDLRAVTDYGELEHFYRELHAKKVGIRPREPRNAALKAHIKKKLCKHIFKSSYYDTHGEDWLDVDDPRNRLLITNHFPNSSTFVFKLRERPRFKCWGEATPRICWRDEFEYENDYRIQPIYFDDGVTLNEYMFSCFTRDRQTGEVREYFVSQEYDLTESMANSSPMAGRFVFCYDEDNELSLNTLAEEAAIGSTFVDKTRVAELHYLKFRANNYASETADRDPLCTLPFNHKLRLCATIFAARIFKNKIKFRPNGSNVQAICIRKRVSFLAAISKRRRFLLKVTRRKVEKDREYDEWMIRCNVLDVVKNEQTTYYVSRGDIQHSVFLYSHQSPDQRAFVDNYMKNVSVAEVGETRSGFETLVVRLDSELGGEDETSSETDDDDAEVRQNLIELSPIFRRRDA